MAETILNTNELKELLKIAIMEILQEHREVLTDVITEAMEDIALVKAIQAGENTEIVSREAIFNILSDKS